MKRLLFLFLLCAGNASAQTQTLVSGTLVDPNGIAYYPANVTACLSPATLNPTVGGRAVNPNPGANYCVGPTTTSVTGFFSLALWPNANISPAATTWVFSIAASGSGPPAGNGPLNFQSAGVTISGATQDVSTNINSVGTAQLKAGSGGVGSGAAPIMGLYLGNTCPVANTGSCFFTPANTQQAVDVVYTSGSKNVSAASAHWVQGDVGKRFMAYGTCNAEGNISVSNNLPYTTGAAVLIVTVTDSTHIITDTNAANSVASNGCAIWGNPDDVGAAAMDAAAVASNNCQQIHLAAGYYWFNNPHFFTQPAACRNLPTNGGFTFGNVVYAAGYTLEGRDTGTTVIWIPPGFPEAGGPGCVNGISTNSCFVIPVEGRWSRLQISGGGNYVPANLTGNNTLLEIDGPASIDNFMCTNFGAGVGAFKGMILSGWVQGYQVNLSACGNKQIVSPATLNTISATFIKLWVENISPTGGGEGIGFGETLTASFPTQTVRQFSKYDFICYDCTISGEGLSQGGATFLIVNRNASAIKWYRGGLTFTAGGSTNGIGYDCVTTSGGLFDVQDATMDFSAQSATGMVAIQDASVGCTTIVKHSVIKGGAGAGGLAYNSNAAASVLVDEGSNTWSSIATSGALIADGHSVKAACTGVVTASLTTGGIFGTGPNIAATACNAAPNNAAPGTLGVGIPIPGARTVQNMVVTATAAGTNASSGVVTVMKNGVATTITCTVGTGTRCVDGTHSVVFADGDLISIQYTTQAADTLAGLKVIVEWN